MCSSNNNKDVEACMRECKVIAPTFRINTMTLFAETGFPTPLKINDIKAKILELGMPMSTLSMKDNNHFPNSIIFKCTYNKHIVIKAFSTGNFQITGSKNFTSATIAVSEAMRLIVGLTGCTASTSNPTFKIQMINGSFKLGKHMRLEQLYNELMNDNNAGLHSLTYEKNDHPAINLKRIFNGKPVTLLIFRTGSVIVTGAHSFISMLTAMKWVMEMFGRFTCCMYIPVVVVKVPKKRGRKRKVEGEMFYSSANLLL
jgi:TATA-box binding protein (TBP) (component of TFIID and TFIIIB)